MIFRKIYSRGEGYCVGLHRAHGGTDHKDNLQLFFQAYRVLKRSSSPRSYEVVI